MSDQAWGLIALCGGMLLVLVIAINAGSARLAKKLTANNQG